MHRPLFTFLTIFVGDVNFSRFLVPVQVHASHCAYNICKRSNDEIC